MNGFIQDLNFCCGVREIGGFYNVENKWNKPLKEKEIVSGTQLAVPTFTNTPACKAAYEWMSKRFKILYQSDVRKNGVHNDKTEVFLVVWEIGKEY